MTTQPTPSQAEGEPDTSDPTDEPTTPQTTPSQAEGERDDDTEVTATADTTQ
ncbi:hypothetical protein [Streptomyces sp. Ru71]|uniref:hypothetical protein n=1 Tax=Streptomyces sp. Ru71 TaxID=2080746 RepID=UPI0015E3DF56|nr:hypothetical protein [Streptomyces sp. Ru71]